MFLLIHIAPSDAIPGHLIITYIYYKRMNNIDTCNVLAFLVSLRPKFVGL